MIIPGLDLIVNELRRIATAHIRGRLEREEWVIRLLKQFKLDPEHPPADFSGVYKYALVEYGVGKPEPILELFRQSEMQQAFRQAFDQNNFLLLETISHQVVDSHTFGDQVKSLGIDLRRELMAFSAIFIAVTRRTRTPAEVLENQRLESLHQVIMTIQDRLDRLPTLDGIRTEMARLVTQAVPALPAGKGQVDNGLYALAQQLRGWFETIGHRFEPYEVGETEHFEWIIQVTDRRGRYDRILVRGIEGEVELRDVMALQQSVETQQTDEGWLVTTRRISPAAREAVERSGSRHLYCYTLDELIDQDADFSSYIEWLESEIERRGIATRYVPLACSKEEVDPVTKQRLSLSRYDERDGWIDGYIDRWLDDSSKEHISVLGEFGTGKTWFAFHYAWTALQRYQQAKERGTQRPRLPLIITLRDYARALNVENVLAGFFFTQHNIRLNNEVFDQLNRMGKLLLIFDGFDEMAAKVDKQQMINNFWELAKVVLPGAKVILTCRTEHFPEAQEGRALLNAELQASTANLTGETPQFEVLELEKLNDNQIRQLLSLQANPSTVERVMGDPQLLDLARRPIMTELILEALPELSTGKPIDMSRIYLYAVQRKMERDIKAERTFTSLADKLYFLCELAWEMLSIDQMSLNYRLFPDRIRRLFGKVVQAEKDLDHWHYDMMGQTMLVRNADGDYAPAHRSLLEFFVAYKFAAELGALAPDFLELAQQQAQIDTGAETCPYRWSDYFQRRVDPEGNILPTAPLQRFLPESLAGLKVALGQAALTKAVLDLLLPMLEDAAPLLEILKTLKNQPEEAVGYVGGNITTLLTKLDRSILENQDLSQTVLHHADFTTASLKGTNLGGTDLTDCVFKQTLGTILALDFSPDGQYLLTGDSNGMVCLRQVVNGHIVLSLKPHPDWVWSVAFSPDGHNFISVNETLKLWQTKTGNCLHTMQAETPILSARFHPDGQLIISGGDNGTVKLWEAATGHCLATLPGHVGRVWAVAFHPAGQIFASGGEDNVIRLWDLRRRECYSILKGHRKKIKALTFSPDGHLLASASDDCSIKLWEVATGEYCQTLEGHTDRVWTVAFSPDGQWLVSGSEDQTIRVWQVNGGQCLATFTGHPDWVRRVAFSPDGCTLASGGDSATLKLWDVPSRHCLYTLQGHSNGVWAVDWSPNGQILASGSEDGLIRLWDIRSGECLHVLQGHTNRILALAFSPVRIATPQGLGHILVSGSDDETGRIWDIHQGKCLHDLRGHTNRVRTVSIAPDGQMVATGSEDGLIKLWDIHSGQCLQTLEGHINWVWSVAFSPDNRLLVSGGDDGVVRLWDVSSGQCLQTLKQHTDAIRTVAFSSGAPIFASGGHDKTIRIWDGRTGECLRLLEGDLGWIWTLAFSPVPIATPQGVGQILASGSSDQTITLWYVSTGQRIGTLRGHTDRIRSVSFSPNGRYLASGSDDETIRFWEVQTGRCLKTLSIPKPYEALNITGAKGLTEADRATLKALGAIDANL